jgi:hypothetical protein
VRGEAENCFHSQSDSFPSHVAMDKSPFQCLV